VDVEDRRCRVGAVDRVRELVLELLLRALAVGVPRRRVAPAERDEVELAEVDGAVLCVGDRAVVEVGDELLEVVVAEADQQADPCALEPLVRELDPLLGSLDDEIRSVCSARSGSLRSRSMNASSVRSA